ncbi:MAG: hypothetical protein V1755_05745 [Chloroflexota bacterium]
MQHGERTKYHLLDLGWFYGEFRWISHTWSKRGEISGQGRAQALRRYKRQFVRSERRRGKALCMNER